MQVNKEKIINLFRSNVKDVEISLENFKANHDGKEGHWLELKMGIKQNSNKNADIYGFEMKKQSNKVSIGDYSATEYAFTNTKKRRVINIINNWDDNIKMSKEMFIKYFGMPNINKNNRYSWSGKCVPKFGQWNECGQILTVSLCDSLCIWYSYEYDIRTNKINYPEYLKKGIILIAYWNYEQMSKNINMKFNQNGFFICKKSNKTNKYESICFGKPFNYDYFIKCVKDKKIIFDSGMYEGNHRNYSSFRGTSFWNDLLIEEYF